MMETGLFDIQADHLRERQHSRQFLAASPEVIKSFCRAAKYPRFQAACAEIG
jgi:hypothetical protein